MGKKERIVLIDLLKGFGIGLMVIGHVGFSEKLNHYLYAFHMPLFFLVSGFVSRPVSGSFGSYVKKLARQLLIPFGFFGLTFGILFYAAAGSTTLGHLAMNFLAPNVVPFDWCGAVWFLMSLFVVKAAFGGLQKWLPPAAFHSASVLIGAAGMAVSLLEIKLPLTLDTSLVAYLIYWIGCISRGWIAQNRDKIHRHRGWLLAVCLLLTPLIFLNAPVNMRENRYGNFLLFFVNMVSSLSLWAVLLGMLSRQRWFRRVQTGLQFLCDHSISYMVFNQFLMVPFIVLILRRLSPGPVYLAAQCAELIFVLLAAAIGSVAIKKMKLGILLGQR
jgi:fucose 4-O-acetylase-like acetyltransferase